MTPEQLREGAALRTVLWCAWMTVVWRKRCGYWEFSPLVETTRALFGKRSG